jgi:HAD superfamily hydrolase (TIGR01549 family)
MLISVQVERRVAPRGRAAYLRGRVPSIAKITHAMPIRAVLFDAGNTLVWLDHPFIVELLREHGFEVDEHRILEAEYGAKLLLDELVRTGRTTDSTRGPIYFAEVFRQLGIPEERFAALAQRLWARHAERNLWCGVREHTAETLEQLRASGLKLGVISNADGRVEALLELLGLRGHFDFVIDSTVVGVEKPDPRIFRLGLEQAGVEAHEAVYVGDVYEIDIVGARGAGMLPFLIDPLGRFDQMDCERIAGIDELPARLAALA